MAARYRLGLGRRAVNRIIRALLRLGLGPAGTYLLTVAGQRSGAPRSTPVTLVEDGGRRWLVSPYGEVAWVRNLRAARRATLSRGGRTETITVSEIGVDDSGPVRALDPRGPGRSGGAPDRGRRRGLSRADAGRQPRGKSHQISHEPRSGSADDLLRGRTAHGLRLAAHGGRVRGGAARRLRRRRLRSRAAGATARRPRLGKSPARVRLRGSPDQRGGADRRRAALARLVVQREARHPHPALAAHGRLRAERRIRQRGHRGDTPLPAQGERGGRLLIHGRAFSS